MLIRWMCAVVLAAAPAHAAQSALDSPACAKAKQKLDADFEASSKDIDVRVAGVCMFYPQLITKAKAKVAYYTACPAADEGGMLADAKAEIAANEEKARGCKK
jgi:hypothetical protein